MGKYQAYPEYYVTGDNEISKVPADWNYCSLKRYLTVQSGDMLPAHKVKEDGIPVVGGNGFRGFTDEFNTLKDTVVIGRVGAKCGCIHTIRHNFWASEHAFKVIPRKKYSLEFMAYCLASLDLNKFAITTAQPLLNTEIVTSKNIAIPKDYEEQQKIANFLDHETAKIDTLIEKQQQLIALLKEKRQAVISHAVTKGLNPDAPMRDSGVEWLGEVPEDWTVCKIKQVAKLESGHTPDKKIEAYWVDCKIPWVSLNDSTQLKQVDYITETAFYLNEKGIENSSARKLPARCVVFTRDASIGLAAITTEVMAVSQHVIAWVCDEKKVIPEYLLLVFYAMKEELDRYTAGATLKTIGLPDVNKLSGVFPQVKEQKILTDYVFSELKKFDLLIEKANILIGTIQERRIALISAAVTGKVDVRDWQAN